VRLFTPPSKQQGWRLTHRGAMSRANYLGFQTHTVDGVLRLGEPHQQCVVVILQEEEQEQEEEEEEGEVH